MPQRESLSKLRRLGDIGQAVDLLAELPLPIWTHLPSLSEGNHTVIRPFVS